jgi:hypothetical protein
VAGLGFDLGLDYSVPVLSHFCGHKILGREVIKMLQREKKGYSRERGEG